MTAGGLLLLGLLVTAYWHWAAGQVMAGLENWRQQQIARGFVVNFGEVDLTGYPFALDLSLSSPEVSAPDGRYWQGPAVTGNAALWDPFTINADISGTHRFGGFHYGGEFRGLAQQASLQAHLDWDGTLNHAVTSVADMQLLYQDAQLLQIGTLDAVLGPLRPADGEQLQELDFDGSAHSILLPEDGDTPLGNFVESLSLKATLRGPLPAQKARQALPIWRDAGGEAIVHSADVAWGPLNLHAKGGAKLDAFLRPEGQFGTRISGLSEVINRLVERGQIKPAQAGMLSFALLSLGGGDARNIALPISMKDGLLSAGPVPIASLKPVL
ncbi:DUF2125 domain-containing protein [Denitrobaculum tricleocarpae]|nr:DUF2125 domain-containing protein [Denitrobaculum tricleocarpae]